MTKIKPLQDNVLLKKVESQPTQEEKVEGGIIVPSEDTKSIVYGEVVDISKHIQDSELQKGDYVIYSQYGGEKIEIDDEEYILMKYKDISGIVTFD